MIDSQKFQAGLLLAGLLTPILPWPGFGSRTFSAAGFLPHSYCFGYQRALTSLNAASDIAIGLSYLAALATLASSIRHGKPFVFRRYFSRSVVIVAAALRHLIEVWTLSQPRYWLASE